MTDLIRRYSRDLIQDGLEIPCIITLQGAMDLIDKASKLLALSDMEVVIPATEIVTTSLQAGKTNSKTKFNDDSFLAIPAGKR